MPYFLFYVFELIFFQRRKKGIVGVSQCDEIQVGNFVCIFDERNEHVRRKQNKRDVRQWK